MASVGAEFAAAMAAKDGDRLRAVLAPSIDFRALTPNRNWEASDPEAVVEIILGSWLGEDDLVDELVSFEQGGVSDRTSITYRLGGHNGDGPFLLEQHAYLTEADGRIGWMRVLCSGFGSA